MPEVDSDLKRLEFEREKWLVEKAYRDREVSLKEAEYNRSRWTSPLVIAIFAAALAALGNVGLAYVNGDLQRTTERDRVAASNALEKRKSEYALVLEMIKTGSSDKAAENLQLLVDTGLLTDEGQASGIRSYLQRRRPGQGAALPVSEVPHVVTEERLRELQRLWIARDRRFQFDMPNNLQNFLRERAPSQ